MGKIKTFNIRLSRELWVFLKRKAIDDDISMNSLIISCVERLKKKSEKKELTQSDANV